MRRVSSVVTATTALLCGLLFTSMGNAAEAEGNFAEGRILVMPAAGLANDRFEKLLRKANRKAKKRRRLRSSRVHVIDVPAKMEKVIARFLARHPNITFAELDERIPPDAVVNDPNYSKQWHLPLMGAPSAWQVNDGEGITVAVLDTGVNGNHPDLSGQVLPGWNTASNNTDTTDIHNHGTWVAGVIAAKVNNAVGGASVAPGAKILPIRITNRSDGAAYFSDMAEGIMWAADNGARVANLSYGGAAGSASIANAANYMMGKGGVVMVSAGNDNTDYGYMNHPSLYVAGATTSNESRASYSSYGNFVDITAPGSGIYTTSRSGGYSTVNGTSFASPNTAAVAALVMAANPTLLPTDVMAVISNTAVDLGQPGWDPSFGYGRVDALAAVQLAAGVETSDKVAPETAIVSPGTNETVAETVAIVVAATDAFGVARVDFLVNDQLIASETQTVGDNEYRFAWDSTKVDNGQYRIRARAFDAAENMGETDEIIVEVANVIADEEPPVVTILSPTPGSSGSDSVGLMATATDNNEVTQISISVDGNLRCAESGSTASCTWDLSATPAGSHEVTATAQDGAGNSASQTVMFTVERAAPEQPVEPPLPEQPPVPEEPVEPPTPEEPPVPEQPVEPPTPEQPPIPEEPVEPPTPEEPPLPEQPVEPPAPEQPPVPEQPVEPPVPDEPIVTPEPEKPVEPPVPDEPIEDRIIDDNKNDDSVIKNRRLERERKRELRKQKRAARQRAKSSRNSRRINMERFSSLGRWHR